MSPCREGGRLDGQLDCDGHDHFENGHEGGDLTEVAAADHLSVDLQAALVVLARHATADLVKPAQDVGRELRGERGRSIICSETLFTNGFQ